MQFNRFAFGLISPAETSKFPLRKRSYITENVRAIIIIEGNVLEISSFSDRSETEEERIESDPRIIKFASRLQVSEESEKTWKFHIDFSQWQSNYRAMTRSDAINYHLQPCHVKKVKSANVLVSRWVGENSWNAIQMKDLMNLNSIEAKNLPMNIRQRHSIDSIAT